MTAKQVSSDGLHADLTRQIIGAAYEVHRELGHGFLEKVYTTALLRELRLRGFDASGEVAVPVYYKDIEVGLYFADVIVNGLVICETKAVRTLLPEHESQLLHYLRATRKEVGLLLNFGSPSVQVKRLIFTQQELKD